MIVSETPPTQPSIMSIRYCVVGQFFGCRNTRRCDLEGKDNNKLVGIVWHYNSSATAFCEPSCPVAPACAVLWHMSSPWCEAFLHQNHSHLVTTSLENTWDASTTSSTSTPINHLAMAPKGEVTHLCSCIVPLWPCHQPKVQQQDWKGYGHLHRSFHLAKVLMASRYNSMACFLDSFTRFQAFFPSPTIAALRDFFMSLLSNKQELLRACVCCSSRSNLSQFLYFWISEWQQRMFQAEKVTDTWCDSYYEAFCAKICFVHIEWRTLLLQRHGFEATRVFEFNESLKN